MQAIEKVALIPRMLNLHGNKYYRYFDVKLFQDTFFVSERYYFFFSKLPTKLASHANVLRRSSRVRASQTSTETKSHFRSLAFAFV